MIHDTALDGGDRRTRGGCCETVGTAQNADGSGRICTSRAGHDVQCPCWPATRCWCMQHTSSRSPERFVKDLLAQELLHDGVHETPHLWAVVRPELLRQSFQLSIRQTSLGRLRTHSARRRAPRRLLQLLQCMKDRVRLPCATPSCGSSAAGGRGSPGSRAWLRAVPSELELGQQLSGTLGYVVKWIFGCGRIIGLPIALAGRCCRARALPTLPPSRQGIECQAARGPLVRCTYSGFRNLNWTIPFYGSAWRNGR